jgi:hypothetical protein
MFGVEWAVVESFDRYAVLPKLFSDPCVKFANVVLAVKAAGDAGLIGDHYD